VDLLSFKTQRCERYFLLSNTYQALQLGTKEESKPIHQEKIKRVKNGRKKKLKSTHFQYKDELIEINGSNEKAIFPTMLNKMIEQLDIALEIHGRVMALRFDLHQKEYTCDNEHLTKFRKRLIQKLQRDYNTKNIGYVWVREREKAKAQHYHWVLFIDGDKVKYPSVVLEIIKELWGKGLAYGGHVPTIKNPYYYCDNPEVRADAIYRFSYLAKTRGKGYRDKQAKDYSTSRLKVKS
jgi:hypothetical protein